MSLASPYQEHYYVADGVTTSFSFGEYFTGLSQAYVKCIIYFDDGTNCVPTFTVDMTTGFITIVTLTKPDGTVLTVPPAGSIVRVFRDTPEQQNVTASQLQNYTAKQLERIFDSVVAMIQEVSYSDLHKTIRLTETQRDVSMEQLKEENDQAILYWDFETRQLKVTDYGQNQVVKSDTVDRLVYLQPEGKIYFIPKGSNNPIAIGSATIHNDLGGRNAPDCHPESAITNLTTHLQELRDADTALAENVQTALNRSQEAKDTADEAKGIAEYAQTIAEDAKDIAEDAKETAEGIENIAEEAKDIAQDAKDVADEALDKVTQEITDREDADEDLQDQIDSLSGRGRFLALWNCATGLAESNPPESPYLYKAGDYFIVGVVSTADPAVNYKPDGSSYTTGVASTVVETGNVGVDDVYLYDGTNWLLQINTQKTVTFAAVAGSPYDNINLGNALDAKADETNTINGAPLSNSETFFYGTSATAGLTADKKVSIPSITTLKKGVVIFVKPDMTATTGGITLKLNDFAAYPVRYNGASISSTTDSIVWNQSYVSIFVFDGLYWQFAGHGYDKDTTYTGSDGITLTGTNFTNSGVRSISTGSTNGTISVNTNGTSADVSVYGLGSAAYTASTDYATSAQGAKADTAVQPGDLATVATTGDYDDLLNKPTIPTVNDATLTIQKNGTNVATFTANASSAVTANISVPTDTNDLTNGAGYITGITSSDVTTALGYTPYSDANPNGYTSNVGTVTSVNSVSPDGSGNVSLTIPTVNNPTITITQGGVTKGSFTLNQASGDTIALDAGGGGSVDIDNLTITKNSDDEIQAVATVNANTAVGATNPVYDWVGTLAEYTSQDVATNHPDWVCYITDDVSGGATVYTKTQVDTGFVAKGHEVIAFQEPTSGNNYTWYRKYADGWVEQGGYVVHSGNTNNSTMNLPVTMSDTNYIVELTKLVNQNFDQSVYAPHVRVQNTTNFTYSYNTDAANSRLFWQVSGIAA